ncbi:zinc finger and SCAN domain-containing protein 2-like [Phyllopteryx taeniolatus]|uniref:zinc finger and SCAN domain-containing protein 2-like n=1 Tax=Phyllopteryx taeniolatus TaxID=161469 RepID=UPI002AD54B60|nr:zinc finger and SCAN domain-containing protein 2-like [Phyllopteryx taeniolatus]
MCKVEMLRALLNQRLSAAVEEIFAVFARTITEYEEELCRTKEENERQRQLLDAVFKKPRHVPDVCEEELRPERQESSSGPEREGPRPPCIKVEEEGGHLQGPDFSVYRVIVKSEDDEDKGQREAEPASGSSGRRAATRGGRSKANSRLAPLSDSGDTMSDTDDERSKGDAAGHADDKHVKCAQCDKTFGNKRNLKRHMRCHTGEKPFLCSDCGKRFSRKDYLITHTRKHTGEKPFSCSVCNSSFTFQSALFQHMETHFGEKPQCPQCDKTFGNKRNLIRHMRRHTGEKPCVCSFCGERFSLKRSLIRHIRTHIGEKTFSCSVCNTTFCYQSGLSKHMKKHAGDDAQLKRV